MTTPAIHPQRYCSDANLNIERANSMKKPARPYPDFPLFLHCSGQWAKKIRGKTVYFGKDADAALKKYLEQRDDLQAGRTPRDKSGELTLREMVNRFLSSKRNQMQAGELSARTWTDYYNACESMIEFFG
jgi:hypothetical protein